MSLSPDWVAFLDSLDADWAKIMGEGAQVKDAEGNKLVPKKVKVGKRYVTKFVKPVDFAGLYESREDNVRTATPTPAGANPRGRGVKLPEAEDDNQAERRRKQSIVDAILAPLNRVAHELEDKWGVDRLPALVSEDLAERFASAAAKLSQAVESGDLEAIKQRAEIMRRGWMKLDEAAEQARHDRWVDPNVWEGRLPNGKPFLVVRHAEHLVEARRRMGVGAWSLDELGRVLAAFDDGGFFQSMKDEFGGELLSARAGGKA